MPLLSARVSGWILLDSFFRPRSKKEGGKSKAICSIWSIVGLSSLSVPVRLGMIDPVPISCEGGTRTGSSACPLQV